MNPAGRARRAALLNSELRRLNPPPQTSLDGPVVRVKVWTETRPADGFVADRTMLYAELTALCDGRLYGIRQVFTDDDPDDELRYVAERMTRDMQRALERAGSPETGAAGTTG